MAVTDQQKLDFLLKKIGYTKTKTGSVVGTGAISGTPKQPFAEAIPSPLVVANASLWNEADSIPATPPGADTTQVKVYLAGTSGLRMTADATSSGQRAYIAYTTYGNTSSVRLTNWIDTQFGASYIIKVYKGDPNSGGVALSAAGSGSNDGWFFDYSAGVLNFNDTSVPSGVTDTNIYIVGYRYIGQTGAPTSGISTFSYLDLTVERNLDVGIQGGISTFRNNIDLNADLDVDGHTNLDNVSIAGVTTFAGAIDLNADLDVDGHTNLDNVNIVGVTTFTGNIDANGDLDVDGHTNLDNISVSGVSTFTGDATFSGNVSIGGTLTYEDVVNVDSVGIITARAGIRVTGGVIEAQAGQNKIPSLYSTFSDLPSAGSYHGMFAHVHNQGRGYFAHAGNWMELVNKELNGVVGTGTERYNVGPIDAVDINVSSSSTTKSFNVTGISTFGGNLDINADIDVDGHTNLDNVSIAGVTTLGGIIEGVSGQNKIPSLYTALTDLPSAGSYHGMFAHVHVTGRGYFAHAGNWLELVNKETNGTVGTGTETYNIGGLTATGIDLNGDIDVDGHTNLDNVSISGVTTTSGLLDINAGGQANTFKVEDLTDNRIVIAGTGGELEDSANLTFDGSILAVTGSQTISGDIDVDGHTNLDNVSIAGVTTAAGNIVANGSIDLAGDIDVDGHTNLDNVSIAGVTTAAGNIVANGSIDLAGDIDVDGHTNLDNVSVAGVTTFASTTQFDATARFNNRIAVHDGTTGSNGQYLKSVGTGVTWATFPTMRTRDTITASAGQQTFHFSYTVNFIDVFVNGIKLTDSEFTATNGTAVVLSVGCFVGDIVELVSYNTVSHAGGGGGGGNLNNVVEDTSPQLGGNLDLFHKTITGTGGINMTGVVTATAFVGNGSGLTGVVASGTGIVIKNSGSVVGTAGTIDFGDNLSVSPASAGIVTITGSAAGTSGITTISGVVNVANDLDVDGHTNLDNVSIAGVVTATTFVGNGDFVELDVDGHTNLDNVSIAGVTTGTTINATTFVGNGDFVELDVDGHTNLDNVSIAGVTTFAGAIDANGDLDVDGHTELDNVNIAGVVTATTFKGAVQATSGTFSSGVDITGDLDVDGHTDLDNVSVAGVTSVASLTSGRVVTVGTGGKLQDNANLTFDGSSLFVSGINVTSAGTTSTFGADIVTRNLKVTGITTLGTIQDLDISGDLDVDGHTNLDNVTIAGVATFSSVVNAATFSGAASANNLTGGTVPSARLSGSYDITNTGSAANIVVANENADAENFIVFTNSATGSQGPKTGSNLKFNASNGTLTATTFIGDGSGLSGITAEGTGIGIREDNNVVGTASTINFTEGVSVTPVSSGITTVGIDTSQLNLGKLNVSGISTFNDEVLIESSIKHIGDTSTSIGFPSNQVISFVTNGGNRLQIGPLGQVGAAGANYGTSGQVLTSSGTSGAVQWTTVNPNVGITTSLTGSFGSNPGNPTTINTYGYGTDDFVVEYTVYVYTGSNMQTQKVLASRIGTTITYTNFAIHYNSSLLIQCDVIRSGGNNFVLRATPESGVGGTINYRIKREVM